VTYKHEPHPWIHQRKSQGPVTSAQVKGPVNFNSWLATKITKLVGTMWCAYLFAVISLLGLRPALKPGGEGIVAWIAQTFLQLVLLSIIIVGQQISQDASDLRAESTFKDAEAILHEAVQLQLHLTDQDEQSRKDHTTY
jgi:hypothetical protein